LQVINRVTGSSLGRLCGELRRAAEGCGELPRMLCRDRGWERETRVRGEGSPAGAPGLFLWVGEEGPGLAWRVREDVFVSAGERDVVQQLSRTPGPQPLRMDRVRQVAQVRLGVQVLFDHPGQRLCVPGDVALAAAAAGLEAALHVLEHGESDLLVFVGLLGVLDV
jgi:hypothetical protein